MHVVQRLTTFNMQRPSLDFSYTWRCWQEIRWTDKHIKGLIPCDLRQGSYQRVQTTHGKMCEWSKKWSGSSTTKY